jgi:hypothetical protein
MYENLSMQTVNTHMGNSDKSDKMFTIKKENHMFDKKIILPAILLFRYLIVR